MRRTRIDKPLLFLLLSILLLGMLTFTSAAFGSLARGHTNASSVVFNHFVLGIGLGLVACAATTFIDYRLWRRLAPYLYALSLLITATVFIPGIGMLHGGGLRWIQLFGFTFQPAETMKIGAILFSSALFAMLRTQVGAWQGLAAFFGTLAPPALLLILQPDVGTLGVICISVLFIFIAAGASIRGIAAACATGCIVLALLAWTHPHVEERVLTFIDPSRNPQGEGYQIRQSLIATGSGGLWGRGFGQGVQKFTYLPEPMGDSIFAVAGEELGFLGTSTITGLFLLLALRGFWISARAPDFFGSLVAVGISAFFVSEAFINIASMLSIAPLTGIPLTFMSQGGSAMLISLGSAGILLNISRHTRR